MCTLRSHGAFGKFEVRQLWRNNVSVQLDDHAYHHVGYRRRCWHRRGVVALGRAAKASLQGCRVNHENDERAR